ncbi:hypothetical protein [Bradyrhizobium elkanii]
MQVFPASSKSEVLCLPHFADTAWLLLVGKKSRDVLAKACSIDLRDRSFPSGHVAQTLIFDLGVILARSDVAEFPCYHVLLDRSYALYLWNALLAGAAEFDGGPVGLSAIRQSHGRTAAACSAR